MVANNILIIKINCIKTNSLRKETSVINVIDFNKETGLLKAGVTNSLGLGRDIVQLNK